MAQLDKPDSAAVLLLDLPPGILCGIDLLSFTTTTSFNGIKNLPTGLHFIFTSETLADTLRDGHWFYVPAFGQSPQNHNLNAGHPFFVQIWNTANNSLRAADDPQDHTNKLEKLWHKGLSPYRQQADAECKEAAKEDVWQALTAHITPKLLSHLTGHQGGDAHKAGWHVSSATCADIDDDHIPGLSNMERNEGRESAMGSENYTNQLGILGIDLKKTWPDGAVGRERTEAAIDFSWALEHVIEQFQGQEPVETLSITDSVELPRRIGSTELIAMKDASLDRAPCWGSAILGQMEACFILVLTLANYSCLEEWKRCVQLVLGCVKAVQEHSDFFVSFLRLLRRQLACCEMVDGGLFDMSNDNGNIIHSSLKNFKKNAIGNERALGIVVRNVLEELELFLKQSFGWHLDDEGILKRGMLDLEDGERIEVDFGQTSDGVDEDGDYRPVVVELET